jgi:abhydrolase domain-containing protein 17
MKLFVLSVVLLYLAVALLVHLAADRMIFLPPASSYDAGSLPVFLVPGDDGTRIATLHLRHPEATHTILYSHGNAEDLGHLAPFLEGYRAAGFSVLAYDYRGYGMSTGGAPTAAGASRDLRAVYDHATRELGIPPERIILLGRSVGSGPAVELAAEEPVAGLIVESGFTSAFRVVLPAPLLPFDRFPNLKRIRRVRAPVLVVHGVEDEVVPVAHGRRLFEAAREPKQALWVEGAGHHDLVAIGGEEYLEAIRRFARSLEAAAVDPGGSP